MGAWRAQFTPSDTISRRQHLGWHPKMKIMCWFGVGCGGVIFATQMSEILALVRRWKRLSIRTGCSRKVVVLVEISYCEKIVHSWTDAYCYRLVFFHVRAKETDWFIKRWAIRGYLELVREKATKTADTNIWCEALLHLQIVCLCEICLDC